MCDVWCCLGVRSGRHVVIIAQRTILGKNYARGNKLGNSGPRPRSRTLTHVHNAILEVRSALPPPRLPCLCLSYASLTNGLATHANAQPGRGGSETVRAAAGGWGVGLPVSCVHGCPVRPLSMPGLLC